jgi:hypothetical protein
MIPTADMLRRAGEAPEARPSRAPWILAGVALTFSCALAMWAGWTTFRR